MLWIAMLAGCTTAPETYEPRGIITAEVCPDLHWATRQLDDAATWWDARCYPTPFVTEGDCEGVRPQQGTIWIDYNQFGPETYDDEMVEIDGTMEEDCVFLHAMGHVLGVGHGTGHHVMAENCWTVAVRPAMPEPLMACTFE